MYTELDLKEGSLQDVKVVKSTDKPKIVTWEDWIRQLQCAKGVLIHKTEEKS